MCLIETKTKAAVQKLTASALLAMGVFFTGCSAGGNAPAAPTAAQSDGPQTYVAPYVFGDTLPGPSGLSAPVLSEYSLDDHSQPPYFSKSTYFVGTADQAPQLGARTYYAGTVSTLSRGLLEITGTYEFLAGGGSTTFTAPQQPVGWAVELANQAGGLVQTIGVAAGASSKVQPVEPVVPAALCPNSAQAQTYQFVTIPAPFEPAGQQPYTWDPTQETGFGSVDISGTGSAIVFTNIQQSLVCAQSSLISGSCDPISLSAASPNPAGVPATAVTSPQTGACATSFYGNTTVVPGTLSVTNPGVGSAPLPVSLVAIGPTGLLVASNAGDGDGASTPFYQNLLGAGTGALGLPRPSAALTTSALVGAQYMGFFYESGDGSLSGSTAWQSSVASFGFASLPTTCSKVAAPTGTLIYGGDFSGNNPAAAASQTGGGFGRCDMAIDLGTQDPKRNGLYPAATIYVGQGFTSNGLAQNYNFPAVAIAGQLGGKFAIFLVGADFTGTPNQAWGIYLLQSN